jgi:hypothetical protein
MDRKEPTALYQQLEIVFSHYFTVEKIAQSKKLRRQDRRLPANIGRELRSLRDIRAFSAVREVCCCFSTERPTRRRPQSVRNKPRP